jgi:WD repeat-containing protein 68
VRLWDYEPETHKLQQRCALLNKSKSGFMPPLTSFDWNKVDTSLVITSSIDTTCTIWDINTSSARTQLIAHDSEVYDVTFVANSVDIFASVGADGSVRVFDLRSLDHSTIIYEPSTPVPLLRIAANPHDRNVLATVAQDSNLIFVLDIRAPGVPIATLDGHQKAVNSIQWAPGAGKNGQRRHVLASGGDDCQVLMWDLTADNGASPAMAGITPISCYTDTMEVNNITWNATADWLGVVSGRAFQGVRFA